MKYNSLVIHLIPIHSCPNSVGFSSERVLLRLESVTVFNEKSKMVNFDNFKESGVLDHVGIVRPYGYYEDQGTTL